MKLWQELSTTPIRSRQRSTSRAQLVAPTNRHSRQVGRPARRLHSRRQSVQRQIRLEQWCGAAATILLMAGGLSLVVLPGSSEPIRDVGDHPKSSLASSTVDAGEPSTAAADYLATWNQFMATTSTAPATSVAPVTSVIASLPKATPAASRPVVRPPVTSPQTAAAPEPPSLSPDQVVAARCQAARQWVAERGLELPNERWEFRCPDLALDSAGRPHWGVACASCATGPTWASTSA